MNTHMQRHLRLLRQQLGIRHHAYASDFEPGVEGGLAGAVNSGEVAEVAEKMRCASFTVLESTEPLPPDAAIEDDDELLDALRTAATAAANPAPKFASGASRRYVVSRSNTCLSTRASSVSILRRRSINRARPAVGNKSHAHLCASRAPQLCRVLGSLAAVVTAWGNLTAFAWLWPATRPLAAPR